LPKFDHFGFLAPYYDRMAKPGPPVDLLEHLNLNNQSQVLDVGGGTGRVAQTLLPHAASVTVVDLSHKMLEEAKLKSGLKFAMAASENLPYPAESFDAVLIVDAFHHVIDQQQTLDELFRVVKPDGIIVVKEPDIKTFAVKVISIFEKVLGMRTHIISGEQIAGMFASCCKEACVFRKEYTVWVVVKK
jgi:demethylmenaquinone methyltransferase/2-methoxy-6-polyprenyl-1,4-benzoquinol methylase